MTVTADELHVVGPLGSDFWKLMVPPELVPRMAREIDWSRFGRRVMIDALEGMIVLMSSSSTHEELGDAADMTVWIVGPSMSIRVKGKRATRWKVPDDPKNIRLEPDAAFYVGKNAEACMPSGRKAGLQFWILKLGHPLIW